MKEKILEIARKLERGSTATLSPSHPGVVVNSGEKLCRVSVVAELLRLGLLEVAGPQQWRL